MGEEEEKETTWQKAKAAYTGYDFLGCFRHLSIRADCFQQAVQRVL